MDSSPDKKFIGFRFAFLKMALKIQVFLLFLRRRGAQDSRGLGFKGLFSKDFIGAFNTLSIPACLFEVSPIYFF